MDPATARLTSDRGQPRAWRLGAVRGREPGTEQPPSTAREAVSWLRALAAMATVNTLLFVAVNAVIPAP